MSQKINISNRDFLAYEEEVQQLGGSILFYFHNSKIRQWWNDNSARLRTIHDKRIEIVAGCCEMDEDSKGGKRVRFTKPTDEEKAAGKQPEPIFLEGHTKEELDKLLKEFLDKENIMTV